MNDDNEKIYNLKSLILYIKNNLAIVISLIFTCNIFVSTSTLRKVSSEYKNLQKSRIRK